MTPVSHHAAPSPPPDRPAGSCCHAHQITAPAAAMAAAESHCRLRGLRLTPQRRAVLAALVHACQPMGAYDLIEALRKAGGTAPAPIAIYRALDFLKAQGFIHRLETLNAFIACPHRHPQDTRVVFLICETCHRVEEVMAPPLEQALAALAGAHDFSPNRQVLELAGQCSPCRAQIVA